MVRTKGITRRAALGLIGGGAALAASETFGFSNAAATRAADVDVVADSDAYLGLLINDQVTKNQQELLADVTNDTGSDLSVTFSLNDCTQGTLYGPEGGSGCSVTFSLPAGNTKSVHIEASAAAVIPFTITADSTDFSFRATRETEAVSGNTTGAVNVKQVNKFSADDNRDEWSIQKVKVEDGDGDDDLDSVEYEISDSNGNVVATRTDSASGGTYQVQNVTIQPDDSSYDVVVGETYTLSVTGYDVDGNFDVATRDDTA